MGKRLTWGEVKKIIDEHIDDDALINYIDICPIVSTNFEFDWQDIGEGKCAVTIE